MRGAPPGLPGIRAPPISSKTRCRLTELNNSAIRNQPHDPHILSRREYRFKCASPDEKGIVMTSNIHRTIKKVVLAVALAAGSVGLARADDSSMNPFIGDSYSYFNGGNLPQQSNPAYDNSTSAWRQQHPDGMSVREMQIAMGCFGRDVPSEPNRDQHRVRRSIIQAKPPPRVDGA
jgi:hypothetical protein